MQTLWIKTSAFLLTKSDYKSRELAPNFRRFQVKITEITELHREPKGNFGPSKKDKRPPLWEYSNASCWGILVTVCNSVRPPVVTLNKTVINKGPSNVILRGGFTFQGCFLSRLHKNDDTRTQRANSRVIVATPLESTSGKRELDHPKLWKWLYLKLKIYFSTFFGTSFVLSFIYVF